MRKTHGAAWIGPLTLLALLFSWKLPAQTNEWKLAFFGDTISFDGSDVNAEVVREIALAIRQDNPDLVVFAGDYSLSGSPSGMVTWSNAMAPLLSAGVPVLPVLGNHDPPEVVSSFFSPVVPLNGPEGEL